MCFFQGTVATVMTQPFDVMKTRMMNAKPGEYSVSNFTKFFFNVYCVDEIVSTNPSSCLIDS